MFSDILKSSAFSLPVCLMGVVLCGCGGSPAPAPTATNATPAAATPAAPTTTGSAPAATASSPANTGGKETKWIGKIPYDVFYDQPLSIAADTTVLGSPKTAVESVPAMAATTPAMPAASNMGSAPAASPAPGNSAPAAGTANWGEIIPMASLVEEVKNLRTRLTGNLNTVATFNKSATTISVDAAMLAALATVAEVHPEAVSWKANAKFVRDLAAEVSSNATGTGREPFNKSKEPFEKLTIVLDGGNPPEMESKDRLPFGEAVYVADMMKRIETSFSGLKANINTAAKLKEDPSATERELRLLDMLGTMMLDPSYDSSQEDKFKALTGRFTGGAKEAILAVKTGDFDGYHAALNKIQTTCAECHAEYRGSGNAF